MYLVWRFGISLTYWHQCKLYPQHFPFDIESISQQCIPLKNLYEYCMHIYKGAIDIVGRGTPFYMMTNCKQVLL